MRVSGRTGLIPLLLRLLAAQCVQVEKPTARAQFHTIYYTMNERRRESTSAMCVCVPYARVSKSIPRRPDSERAQRHNQMIMHIINPIPPGVAPQPPLRCASVRVN